MPYFFGGTAFRPGHISGAEKISSHIFAKASAASDIDCAKASQASCILVIVSKVCSSVMPTPLTSKPFQTACPPEQSGPQSRSRSTHRYQRWRGAPCEISHPRPLYSSGLGMPWGLNILLRFFGHSRTIAVTPFLHKFDKRLGVHVADVVFFLQPGDKPIRDRFSPTLNGRQLGR